MSNGESQVPRPGVSRRRAVGGMAGVALAGLLPGIAAAAWKPDQNVEFVVPAGAGGALDQVGRAMKQFYDETGDAPPGKTFLVTNKPGANGKIAFDFLKQRPGDGNFLSLNTHGYIASYLTGNLDVLPHREFTTIAVLQDEYLTLAVRADSPIKNVRDLLTAMRRDPGSQRMGVATSIGNHIHVGTAKALKAGGVDIKKLVVAPFKSSSESIVALVGGHLELVASTTPNVITMMQSGKIRLLAISSPQRLGGAFKDVPTWRESGVDSDFSSALGIIAPKGISADQLAYWEGRCKELVEHKEWKLLVERNQSRSNFMPHAEAQAYYEREYQSMRGIVSELGLLQVKA
ncbi:Bug family tripartite tricarboxylate transporter substrate binding protein [Ottowia thiooxydans]|uniref:Tricarboxylic transport membrane protein n=1 Tax=Ottowia thiooxydans TaxID=219182 RepID=A0ABV2QG12_9BURK